MRLGTDPIKKYDLSSLRVLGTVGEPINPEAWRWYHKEIGQSSRPIVDTFWQTETGGHVLTPIPGVGQTKPGSATFPFFGIKFDILDAKNGTVLQGEAEGVGVISQPWPGIARTVYGDHERYLNTYLKPYPNYYFTGDGVSRDQDGFLWVNGRVDDVINVSGHRLGTAEIESALVGHPAVAEAAVVGQPHDVKGQAIFVYVILKVEFKESSDLVLELKMQVRKEIGAFATPDVIMIVPGLPKTRSGKIMRRILRKIAAQELSELGDTSTLAEPSIVQEIVTKYESMFVSKDKKQKL
jgi:acetyl-CoA synthetase